MSQESALSSEVASTGKLFCPLGQLRLVPPQARQGLAKAVCQTNLIGEAIDIPPSRFTGQWALSWYGIPHCGGKTLASQLRDPVALQMVRDPGMLVGNLW